MLSIGIWQQPYSVIPTLLCSDSSDLGHLWSQNGVITLWLRLPSYSNCFPHPYQKYTKCLSMSISSPYAYGSSLTQFTWGGCCHSFCCWWGQCMTTKVLLFLLLSMVHVIANATIINNHNQTVAALHLVPPSLTRKHDALSSSSPLPPLHQSPCRLAHHPPTAAVVFLFVIFFAKYRTPFSDGSCCVSDGQGQAPLMSSLPL